MLASKVPPVGVYGVLTHQYLSLINFNKLVTAVVITISKLLQLKLCICPTSPAIQHLHIRETGPSLKRKSWPHPIPKLKFIILHVFVLNLEHQWKKYYLSVKKIYENWNKMILFSESNLQRPTQWNPTLKLTYLNTWTKNI